MIGAEMSRGAPTVHGGVEHAAEVGAIDRTAVHADSDEELDNARPRSVIRFRISRPSMASLLFPTEVGGRPYTERAGQ